ncbi:MAG: ribosome maturation factor RimP [Acidimicrobiales bacterium]|nr:ribosome maturation factor RimP [Acidimicrobiales bacterium]
MTTTDRVRDLVEPVCAADSVDLVDVELNGGVLRLTVDRDGGLDLDAIAGITRRVSRLLDEHDPVPGRYTLEVSSPGVERRLRTADHFRRAVGEQVSVRTVARDDGPRRLAGELVAADDSSITVRVDGDDHSVPLDRIERARTVFEWGPAPKPGGPRPKSSTGKAAKR